MFSALVVSAQDDCYDRGTSSQAMSSAPGALSQAMPSDPGSMTEAMLSAPEDVRDLIAQMWSLLQEYLLSLSIDDVRSQFADLSFKEDVLILDLFVLSRLHGTCKFGFLDRRYCKHG